MTIRKLIVLLLVFQALKGTLFQVIYFNAQPWSGFLGSPNIFEFSYTLDRLLRILSHIFVFVGVFRLLKNREIELLSIFKFPIYYFIAGNIFWFITTLLSTKYSFFFLGEEIAWHYHVFKILDLALITLIFIHYLSKRKKEEDVKGKVVSKAARFLNWIIDLSIIILFGFKNIRLLSDGFLYNHIEFLRSTPQWFFLINMFCYYFILELLFLQTIGKLHNNSIVVYSGSKFKSILIRTFCRFIPFEPFSFFGKKGWHDSISKTEVVVANKE